MIEKTGHCSHGLFTLLIINGVRPMRRAFIENGKWHVAEKAVNAVAQQKATLRVSALAGLLTLGLIAGPDIRLALPDVHRPQTPAISQPELVSLKSAERVPSFGDATATATATATSALRRRPRNEEQTEAPREVPKAHAQIAVVDAATLRADDMVVRVAGLTLPAPGTICKRLDGLAVSCADRAASYLQLLVKGRTVACDRLGKDADGTDLGRCRIGEADVAEQMIRQGWASAASTDDANLKRAEASARQQKLGIWRE
jgi:endonuclease YncB( thermonuclease family)